MSDAVMENRWQPAKAGKAQAKGLGDRPCGPSDGPRHHPGARPHGRSGSFWPRSGAQDRKGGRGNLVEFFRENRPLRPVPRRWKMSGSGAGRAPQVRNCEGFLLDNQIVVFRIWVQAGAPNPGLSEIMAGGGAMEDQIFFPERSLPWAEIALRPIGPEFCRSGRTAGREP